MRIAVLADVHGNMPALEAVLADVQPLQPDGIIVAGDMVRGPNSVEVLRKLQDLNAWMIRGNCENDMLRFEDGTCPDWWHTARSFAPKRWEYQHMDAQSLALIKSLPEQRVITRPGKDAIRVVHGSVDSPSEHLDPSQGNEPLDRALAKINEPVLVCGHSHVPWQVMKDGCLAFNPGAVSGPINGVTGAQYAWLEWQGDGWALEFRLVPYDLTLIREEFIRTGFLEEGGAFTKALLLELEQGKDFAMRLVRYANQQAVLAGYPDCEYVPDEIWDRAAETFDWEEN